MNATSSLRFALCTAAAVVALSGSAAAQTIPASVSGNAADNDANNLGDNSGAASSVLISAGVFVSGSPGNNGTARMVFEFPISSLAPGPVPAATIRLASFNSSFETLDTFFFAATVDGNGTIENADYEIASAAIASSTMLLSSNVGGTGSHTFDITSELNAALAAGRNYLVIQGRVNESTAGPAYQRGLQVYSHIGGTADQRPRLVVGTNVALRSPSVPVPGPGPIALAIASLTLGLAGCIVLSRRRSQG